MKVTTVQTICGPFDKDRFTRLKAAYEKNLKELTTQFELDGQAWVRSFAFYMLEYLSPALGFGEYKKPD